MKNVIAASVILVSALVAPAPAAAAAVDHSAFDKILRESVDMGLVNYKKIRDNVFDLHVYLDSLANVQNLDAQPREEQLAYYINLYNASVILAVVERYSEDFSPAKNDFAMFKEPRVNLPGGRKISLNDLENQIIRPNFKDPRVHTALVCAAKSCPPLLPRAYAAADLEKTLEQNMRQFVNDPSRNTIDRQNKKLVLSKVFDWYADDFGGKDKIPAYVSKYADGGSVEGYSVSFKDYDWTLNQQ